ncbi:MAG: crossover junction endodeoxyribonuclease RuvC [Armatimonadota bacterium]|nr:crossover junction endodeoxyribonuclease RuvC [Armatimonadota bacterium]MDR7536486.1 crossover junction endodeoxyribonuclease RuvC [Armatimonadota bacterium]
MVLGCDPGLRVTGYAVLRADDGRPAVVDMGVLTTQGRDLGARLLQLYRDVEALLRDARPDVVVLEDLFAHARFPRTAIVLGHARGVLCAVAAAAGVRTLAVAPAAVKQAVTGSGRASKPQVQAALRRLLRLRALGNAHAADALALAYTGLLRVGAVRG